VAEGRGEVHELAAAITRSHVFIVRDRKILVLQQSNGWRWWEQPGGDLESGEDAAGAAIRETFEETGLRIEPPKLLRTWSYRNNSGAEIEAHAFAVAAPPGDVRLSEEHTAHAWMTIDDYTERYCNDALVLAMPRRADFFLGMRENLALLSEWLRKRPNA
jgi:8-oxo-dGTP pyrophosphatase MutT (NUDIX family)